MAITSIHRLIGVIIFVSTVTIFGASACPSGIRTVERPIQKGSSEIFGLRYRIHCVSQNLPTVVVIPGGPGGTSMDDDDEITTANMIYTDPRGAGANADYWNFAGTSASVTSEDLADDIIAIVENAELKNYVLHGISYGTVVATIAGSKIQRLHKSLPQPAAIVLDSTFAKAADFNEQVKTISAFWRYVRDHSGYCVTCAVEQHLRKFPDIGLLLEAALESGIKSIEYIRQALMELSDDKLDEILADHKSKRLEAQKRLLYPKIACHEMSSSGIVDRIYVDGDLIPERKNSCTGIALDRPYKSANWPLSGRVFYLAGTHDVLTPFSHTAEHFRSQPHAEKTLLCDVGGGHYALGGNLSDCANKFWQAIVAGQNLESAIESCKDVKISSLEACEKLAFDVNKQ